MPYLPKLSKKLSKVYDEPVRILGIYIWKENGRKIVDVWVGDTKKTCQLARVKLEIKLGRKLVKGEEVDHIDDDCTNDRYNNLQVLSKPKNASKSLWKVEYPKARCLWCGVEFRLSCAQMERASKKKSGPFCSKKCTGKYGAAVQNGSPRLARRKTGKNRYYK